MIKRVKTKTLSSVRPPAWLAIEYRKKLIAFITKIHKGVNTAILNKYKSNIERITATDASPASELYNEIVKLFDNWERELEDTPKQVASWFAKKQLGYTNRTFKSVLKDAGFTVEMQMNRNIKDRLDAILLENISLINSIPQEYKQEVLGLVQRSVQAGRSLGSLAEELQHRFKLTKDRAVTISRDQNNKAISMLTLLRAEELDITEARWKHNAISKIARPLHLAANGQKFDIRKGLEINGKFVFPGQAINCNCTAELIVPEFNS